MNPQPFLPLAAKTERFGPLVLIPHSGPVRCPAGLGASTLTAQAKRDQPTGSFH